jgi:hypothetical protein
MQLVLTSRALHNLWGERLESAFFGIGILGMFRLRRRIRSDCAQHDRG